MRFKALPVTSLEDATIDFEQLQASLMIPVPIAEGNAITTGQSTFANGTGTPIKWTGSTFLHGGMTFNGTDGFVVPVGGVYRVQGQVTLSSPSSFTGNGYFQAAPTISGSGGPPSNGMGTCAVGTTSTNFPTATSAPVVFVCKATDVVRLALINQTGITVTINEASLLVEFVSI